MKIFGVVILYYPDFKSVVENINRYIDGIEYLIIWDNTPIVNRSEAHLEFFNDIINLYADKIGIFGTGNNEGISFALNKAANWGCKNGFSHMLTMDQDSKWENFDGFLNALKSLQIEFGKNWIAGPNVNFARPRNGIIKVPTHITSGTVMPLNVLKIIGDYNEKFIVDGIDYDICFRANRYKIPTIVLSEYILHQNFSTPGFFRIGKFQRPLANYSPWRLYGILRNCLIVARNYPEQRKFRKIILKNYIIRWSLGILLAEKHKIPKLKALWGGVISGIFCSKNNPTRR